MGGGADSVGTHNPERGARGRLPSSITCGGVSHDGALINYYDKLARRRTLLTGCGHAKGGAFRAPLPESASQSCDDEWWKKGVHRLTSITLCPFLFILFAFRCFSPLIFLSLAILLSPTLAARLFYCRPPFLCSKPDPFLLLLFFLLLPLFLFLFLLLDQLPIQCLHFSATVVHHGVLQLAHR